MDGKQNARIKEVRMSNEDHGVLSPWLMLEYDGGGQGFGGYCVYNPNFPDQDITGRFIWRCLEVVGVYEWSELRGRPIRVDVRGGIVRGIGHFLKDEWFYPADEF